ncbi:alpha/beta hydrolase fold-domain-containing protein [Gongronella butleri]|nr:alpha/beta hydrolase fold-domain-containing protein [Gongronella butleri]
MTNPYLSKAHPVYQAAFERMKLGDDWLAQDPEMIRKQVRARPRPPGYTVPETEVDEREIPVGDHSIKLITVRPPGAGVLPGFIYIHGGGWVIGDFHHTHEKIVKDLAVKLNVVILFIEYTLSPEVKFPVGIEECYNAVLWIKDNADALNIDASKLVMGGDSAGGNLAAANSILLKERGHASVIKGQILLYPIVSNDNSVYPSYSQFGNGDFMLSRKDVEHIQGHYLEDKANQFSDIRFAPILATDEQLKGLPPTLTIVAECDILRDSGEHYAQRLTDVGVDSYCIRVIGAIHGFVTAPGETPIYRHALNNIKTFVHDVLN